MNALLRQTQIYLGGVSGRRPQVPIDALRLEEEARRRLRPDAYAYIAAGAGNERTLVANRVAFDRWRIVPRMLRDVERRDTTIELFGRRLDSPFLLAPIGVLELAHPQADAAVARAARSTRMPMIFSNQSSRPMEEIAGMLGAVLETLDRANHIGSTLKGFVGNSIAEWRVAYLRLARANPRLKAYVTSVHQELGRRVRSEPAARRSW